MKEQQLKRINGIAILLAVVFVLGLIANWQKFLVDNIFGITINWEGFLVAVKAIIMLFFLYLCVQCKNKKRSVYLELSLGAFTLTFMMVVMQYIKFSRWAYYIYTVVNILGYVFLIIYILRQFNFKKLILNFYPYIIVLTVLNVYILYTLNSMLEVDKVKNMTLLAVIFESVYNVVVLTILTLSLLNYLYKEYSKEAFYLLLACLGISFSDIVQLFYLYTDAISAIFVAHSVLELVAYFFLFKYILLNRGCYFPKLIEE